MQMTWSFLSTARSTGVGMVHDLDRKSFLLAGALAVLLLLGAAVTYQQIRQLQEDAAAAAHGQEVMEALAGLTCALQDAETAQHAYFLSGDARHLGPHGLAVAAVNQAFEHLRQVTRDSPEQQNRVSRLGQFLSGQLGAEQRLTELRRRTDASGHGVLADEWKRAAHAATALVRELVQEEQEQFSELERSSRRASLIALAAGLGTALLGLATLVALLWLRRRHQAACALDAGALHAEQELLRVTLSQVDVGVIVTDTEGAILLLNPSAQTLTGWSQDQASGKHLNVVFRTLSAETRQAIDNSALQALRWGRVVELHGGTLLVARDGRECPIAERAAPLRREDGKARGAVLVFRDLSPSVGETPNPLDAAVQTLQRGDAETG